MVFYIFTLKKAENILKEVFARLIQQSSRVELGKKFESGFYAKPDTQFSWLSSRFIEWVMLGWLLPSTRAALVKF